MDYEQPVAALEQLLAEKGEHLRRTLYNLAVDGWRRRTSWRSRLGLKQPPTRSSTIPRQSINATAS
jgi:hypothetical protein